MAVVSSRLTNYPIKKDDEIGNLNIKISGKKNIYVPLVAKDNVGSINPLFRTFAALKYLFFGTSLDEN